MTIHLKGMTWDHPRGYQPLIACSEQYAAEHDVHVTWEKRSLKDFGDQPIDELTADYDVIVIDHPHAGMAAATGCLVPLDAHIDAGTLQTLAEQSAGPSHESYQYQGHQWGLALDAAMQTAVYRADLLDGAIPDSWDAVITLGEQARRDGRYIAHPLIPTDAICSFITLCASLGEPIGQGDGLVSAPTGKEALAILQRIKEVAHPGSLTWNPIRMLDHMSNADDAIYCPLTFNYTNYARAGYAPHRLTFTVIPGVRGSILGGTGFAVSSSTQHPQAAADFGAWLCSAETQRGIFVREGGQPGNIVAWRDADANALTNNFFTNTLPTLETSRIRPRHDGFIPFQEQAGHIIHDFLVFNNDLDTSFDALMTLYDEHRGK